MHPLALGDIFDALFKLIGKTIRRNGAIVFILFLPPALVFTAVIYYFTGTLADIMQNPSTQGTSAGDVGRMLAPLSGAAFAANMSPRATRRAPGGNNGG